MRKCHIDKNFTFFSEEERSPNDNLNNTLNCDNDLYEAIISMETLYNVSYKFDLDFIDEDFHDTYEKLKAKVLLDEIARLKGELKDEENDA